MWIRLFLNGTEWSVRVREIRLVVCEDRLRLRVVMLVVHEVILVVRRVALDVRRARLLVLMEILVGCEVKLLVRDATLVV